MTDDHKRHMRLHMKVLREVARLNTDRADIAVAALARILTERMPSKQAQIIARRALERINRL